jgi:glutamate-1-semialdehyde 2,1-aminomutase
VSILSTFEQKHRQSEALHRRAREIFPDGVTHDTRHFTPFPIYVERAEGGRKWDVDGNEYVDYVSGHGALLLGHGRPEVVRAVQQQVARGTHYGASHALEIEWGSLVQRLIPCAERVRFTSSGTEAVQMAVRLARAYTGRDLIVKFDSHFHGWSDAVNASLTAGVDEPSAAGVPDPIAGYQVILPQNDTGALARALEQHAGRIAAVILEPTGAAMGSIPIDPGFLFEARNLTERTGTVLIFDEVVTGFRIAPGGAQAYFGVTPDLTTLAKILAGGLPGGAVTGRADLLAQIEFEDGGQLRSGRIPHPGTFNANPLSAAAGASALAIVATGEPHARANEAARRLARGMNDALARREIDGCVYGLGSLLHILLGRPCQRPDDGITWQWTGEDRHSVPRTPADLATVFRRAMLNHGVDPMGTRLIVGAAHGDAEIDATLDAFEQTLDEMRDEQFL